MNGKSVLLIISGGIAAYKALELIRLFKKAEARVRCIITKGGQQFVTPLSVSALCGEEALTEDSYKMDHISLTREADMVILAPASANMLAKMAQGLADDLASTTLLATDSQTPVFVAPAMNPAMWEHPATQDNVTTLKKRGITFIGPVAGDAACGENGVGRMSEPEEIFNILASGAKNNKPLAGKSALVTAGPTYEPLDPVRFIGNRSSGKQGYAIAAALAKAGAQVTLVSGPVSKDIKGESLNTESLNTKDPSFPVSNYVKLITVETAEEMLAACQKALPVDIAVCAAAVADYAPCRVENQKIKKDGSNALHTIELKENPDILKTLSQQSPKRPALVIGFAAETENLLENARAKRLKKGCDWLLANDVGRENIFGAEENHVYLMSAADTEEWPKASKQAIAQKLVRAIKDFMDEDKNDRSDRNRTDAA